MRPLPPERRALRALASGGRPGRFIADASGRVALADAVSPCGSVSLDGASVLISSVRQLPAALAMLALDGVARRMLLCPTDLDPTHLPAILEEGEVDTVVTDGTGPASRPGPGVRVVPIDSIGGSGAAETEWVLFTSGTTGRPKLAAHTLQSLTGPLAEGPKRAEGAVWSTFYDIRRYGGLQVLLRALLGGASLVLSQEGEPVGDFLRRAASASVTHILGTPTHWRRALMRPKAEGLAPRYVRLSGEIADQAILNQLARAFPGAELTHAYASTEAGVGFEVTDGLEGFPPSALGVRPDGSEIRVMDGSLRVRSGRTASRYLGGETLADAEGFVDTGDMVVERDGRFFFAGRRSGVINVGGQKVHPEEVEAVITRHPCVRMAQVRGRRSPITGAIVVADLVLTEPGALQRLQSEILATCRAALPPHKVPALLREVEELGMSGAGKLSRA